MKKSLLALAGLAFMATSGFAATATALYGIGEAFEGWDPTKCVQFEQTESGVFSYTLDSPNGGMFAFTTAPGSSSSDWNTVNSHRYYPQGERNVSVTSGDSYDIEYGKDGEGWTIAPGKWTLTVDTNTDKFTPVLVQEGEVEISWGIKGEFFTQGSWIQVPLTKVSDTEWYAVFTPTLTDGNFGVPEMINGATQKTWYQKTFTFNAENPTATLVPETEDEKNCTFGYPANQKYKFTFNPETGVLSIVETDEEATYEQPVAKWFCAWDLSNDEGWKFGNEFEEQTEGTYKVVVTPPSASGTNYFAVFYGFDNTNWNDNGTIRYTPENEQDVEVTEDGTFKMQQGSNGAWQLKQNGEWTVVIDPVNMEITFDWGNSTGEANVLIDRNGDEDHSYESYPMVEDESDANTFTWSGEINAGDKLKFNIHGQDYTYDPAVGQITSADHDADVTMEYELTEGDGMVAFDYAVGDVTFTVDVDNKKVYMTYKDAPDVTLTVTEGENSTIHRVYKKADGYYQTSHTLSFTENESVDLRVLSTRYVPNYEATEELSNGFRCPLVVLADEDAAPAYGGEPGFEYYVTVATEPMMVFFTTDLETAVSEIAAETEGEAVYYNMQGIRVANPENGLYIVVKGGKAVKVIK